MAGFGALAEFDFDHAHIVRRGIFREHFFVKAAIAVAAAKVAAADFPHQIAPRLAVIARNRALAGIVEKPTFFSTSVQRHNRVCTQRAKAHRGNIEYAGGVGLGTGRTADLDAKIMVF